MHRLYSTTSKTITHTIEDVLLRLSALLTNCCSQFYDRARSMQVYAKEQRELYSHFYDHSLNLAIQDSVKGNTVIGEIFVLKNVPYKIFV